MTSMMTTAAPAAARGRLCSALLAGLAGIHAFAAPAFAAAPQIEPSFEFAMEPASGETSEPASEPAPPPPSALRSAAMSGAEKLRRLDIMLMVTGLRCRATPDGFTADYGLFAASHLGELNAANAELKSALALRYGPARAQRELDRLSTVMANGYGQGHPWLSCAELKMVAHNLVAVRGRATLEEAADQLLAAAGPTQLALAR
jgi:hypothetical protein